MLKYHQRRILDLDSFLERFEGVRRVGDRGNRVQYEARCPAHETNHRSLAIAAFSDGTYGVHCHAGCAAADVMAAVGLSLADLYPDGALFERHKPRQRSFKERVDDTVIELAAADRAAGKKLSRADLDRERQAWLNKKNRGVF